MDNEAVSCPTYRLIGDPWPSLQHAVISGCALWLVLDPQSHEQALARLYEYEPDANISELFHRTHLQDLHDISPRMAPVEPQSPMLHWLFDENPGNWGMVLASDAPRDEILDHLRSLLLVKTDGESVILRIWDGSVLNSLCGALPEEIPLLLGPVRRVVARTDRQEWACIDRDGDAFMQTPHQPRQSLPCPWYLLTQRHERAFQNQRPAVLTHNISESLLHRKSWPVLPLPPTERLRPFVARHVGRGMEMGLWDAEALDLFVRCCLTLGESFPDVQPAPAPFSRSPIDEGAAILAMRRICNPRGNHD
jgi:hypothetical protein